MTKFLTLNADCTVTFPPGEEMERDKRVRWKFVPGAPGDAAVNVNQVIANLCFAVLTRRTKCARAKQHSVERPPANAHSLCRHPARRHLAPVPAELAVLT